MITLYGSARSRASRSLIVLEELGLAYEHRVLRAWDSDEDRATILGINPNGRVPALADDGLVLWESMAINLYLADRYGGPLWPTDARTRGRREELVLSGTRKDGKVVKVEGEKVCRQVQECATQPPAQSSVRKMIDSLPEGTAQA